MRTYENWLSEATTGDLKQMGATPAQIATLKKRSEKRGYGFDRGDDRVKKAKSDPLAKASGVKALPAPTKASAASDPLKKAADKGSAIVRQKRGGTGKEAVGAPKKTGPGTRVPRGDGSKTYDRINKGGALAKKPTGGDDFGKPVKGGWSAKGSADKNWNKNKTGDLASAAGKGLKKLGQAAGSVANSARNTVQDKGEKMQDAKVTPVTRGLYNPK